jgi:hypothetical protein
VDDEPHALGQQRRDLVERCPEGLPGRDVEVRLDLRVVDDVLGLRDVRWTTVPSAPESAAMS